MMRHLSPPRLMM